MNINSKFLSLERDAILKLIDNCLEYKDILTEQFKCLSVSERRFTKCGFFTEYKIDRAECKKIERKIMPLRTVDGIINDGFMQVGFLLFFRDGYISCLECFENGGANGIEFPDIITDYTLYNVCGISS